MPKKSSAPSGSYRYTGSQIGERADTALMPDTIVTVRETVDAGTKGAHTDTEDAVVIEWEAEAQVIVNTRFETRGVPVMATSEDGGVLMNNGQPAMVLEQREVPVHEYGTGTVTRAMSVSLERFAADFQEA